MTTVTKAYKVLQVGRFGLVSAIPTAMRQYYAPPGMWTEPAMKGTRLFCFETLTAAEAFRSSAAQMLIYSCEAENVLNYTCLSDDYHRLDYLYVFWNLPHRLPGFFKSTMPAPLHTYGCTRLKLIERIK